MFIRNIHDQQVLHDRVAKVPIGVVLGKIRRGAQLLWSDAPAQHVRADIRKPGLLLRMNANVVAVNIGRNFFRLGGIQREAEPLLQRRKEGVRRPSVLQEQKLQPSALAVLAEHFGFPKELRHAAYYGDNLFPRNESVETNAKMWIGGKPARHA